MSFVASCIEVSVIYFEEKVALFTLLSHWAQAGLMLGMAGLLHMQFAVHEVGHLIGNRVFKVRASGIRVGAGPTMTLFRKSSFRLELGLKPTSGHLYISGPPDGKWPAIFAYASGPLAALLFGAAIWAGAPAGVVGWYWKVMVLLFVVPINVENLCPHAPDGRAILARLRGDDVSQASMSK